MCKVTEIKLCTCGEITKKDFRAIDGIVWELTRQGDKHPFAGLFPTYGIFIIPEAHEVSISDSISADKVEALLNEKDLFDFEYTPIAKDKLVLWDQTAATRIPEKVVTFVYDKKWYYVGNGEDSDYESSQIAVGKVVV